MPKETSPEISSRAGRLLALGKPEWMTEEYWDNLKGILGSALSQDETPPEPKCEVTFTEAEPRDNWTPEDLAESNKLRDQLEPLPSFKDPLGR